MNDPRYYLSEENKPLAFRCHECGIIKDEESIRVVEHPDNLRHYEVVQVLCPTCTVGVARKQGKIWDYVKNELTDIINNLNKQKT
jgi:hypothetical protein